MKLPLRNAPQGDGVPSGAALSSDERPIMPAQDDIDDMLQRVAMAAIAYYPEVATDEPGYRLEADVAWCLSVLPDLAPAALTQLQEVVGQAITDPTRYRQALFGAVLELRTD